MMIAIGTIFRLVLVGIVALSLPDAAFARAVQFSADLIATNAAAQSDAPRGKIFVARSDVRIEAPGETASFFIVQGDRSVAYLVRPAQHLYMDAAQSSVLTQLLVPVDPNDPCRQWQAMADIAGLNSQGDWRCEPQPAAETIAGHETKAYRATSPNGQSFVGWIDRARRFPLQIKLDDGVLITAGNLHDEPQDPTLFELPKGAHKFNPQALIEQIKQSDVWVEPPKSAK